MLFSVDCGEAYARGRVGVSEYGSGIQLELLRSSPRGSWEVSLMIPAKEARGGCRLIERDGSSRRYSEHLMHWGRFKLW